MKKIALAFAAVVTASCLQQRPDNVLADDPSVVMPVRCLTEDRSGLELCEDSARVQYVCTRPDGCGHVTCRKAHFSDPFEGSAQ